jgi:hypothetical protein
MGAGAAASSAVGVWGSTDVEPDCQRLGILEQRNMDSDLSKGNRVEFRYGATIKPTK